jgi:integrase
MFVLASRTGLRSGELLGLTVADIDFDRLLICPRKQADDRTRVLRELKTKSLARQFQSLKRQPAFFKAS